MKKIAVVTSTRAEYGLLSPVIRELRGHESADFSVELIVTGTHLSEPYGMTVQEIERDGLRIDHRIPIPVESGSALDISRNQAAALTAFTELFQSAGYHAVMLLGDRYEMLAIAMAASNTRTPIYHISGGDVTEGAIDDCIRHSITKMSYLHFPTSEPSRRRIIQLGEAPERVFNTGSTSIDNIRRIADMTKAEAMESIGLNNPRYAICTYHPVTLESADIAHQMAGFLNAVRAFPDITFVVTKSNADQGGSSINAILDEAAGEIENLLVFASLGVKRYLSLMKYALFVLGNSSSGVIETPAFRIPTVNIGDRQRGRLQAESVIDCGTEETDIEQAIRRALDPDFREQCKSVVSPYGDGHAAEKICQIVLAHLDEQADLKKKFYDIEVKA